MPVYSHSVLSRAFLHEPSASDYDLRKPKHATTSVLTYKPFFSLFGECYVDKDTSWKTAIGYAFQSLERVGFHVIRLQTVLDDDGGECRRVAYFVGAKDSKASSLSKIWFCCNGTGQFALDLLDLLAKIQIPSNVGFLIYEIPSYGDCEGLPTLSKILQTAFFAEEALAKYLQTDVATIRNKISVFGYSIGCAIGLLYASNVGMKNNSALIAPFVSMKKAVHCFMNSSKNGILGWLAAETASLVAPPFDNEAYLQKIISENPDAKISIFHGTKDTICEFEGSLYLRDQFPSNVTLRSFNGAGHDILRMVFPRICSL
jgi:hypothetical protein